MWEQGQGEMIYCRGGEVAGHAIPPTEDSVEKTITRLLKYNIPKSVPSITHGEHAWNGSPCLSSLVHILLIHQNTAHSL